MAVSRPRRRGLAVGQTRRGLPPRALLVTTALVVALGFGAGPAFAQRSIVLSPPGMYPDFPRISADGQTIVFASGMGIVHLVRPDGSGLRSLGIPFVDVMNLSADGRFLAIADLDGPYGNQVRIIDTWTLAHVDIDPGVPYPAGWPAISADGSTVAFVLADSVLYAADADGSNPRSIGGSLWTIDQPSITADGSHVVFMGEPPQPPWSTYVYRAVSDGSGTTQLTHDPERSVIHPKNSADGSRITFEDYSGPLLAMDGDGTNVIQLSPPGLVIPYAGEGRDFSSISGDGSFAAFQGSGGIFVVRTDGTGLRQIEKAGAGANGQVAIGHRADIVVHKAFLDGEHLLVATGVPGIAPGEIGMLSLDLDGQTLSWIGSPAVNAHNLYRSDLGALSAADAGSCLQDGIAASTATDPVEPIPGAGFGYLVTGENGAGEGTLGCTSGGLERVPGTSCPPVDSDGDGIPDVGDTCPLIPDPLQEDQDGDGLGDLCDNCAIASNPDQQDLDNDDIGDLCECLLVYNPGEVDGDGDGLVDACDNCPSTYNPGQEYLVDPVAQVVFPNGSVVAPIGQVVTLEWNASDVCGGVALVDLRLSRTGVGGPYEPIAAGITNSGSFNWTVTGPATQGPKAFLRVVARDPANNTGQDESDHGFRIR